MKKILLKLTAWVLVVAMIVPFTTIPKVKADGNECAEGEAPEYHTNYYFFLQAETPYSWASMFADESGSLTKNTTNYWTEFLYTFPSDGSKIVFEDDYNEGFVRITDSADYDRNFDGGLAKNRKQWTAGQFFYEVRKDKTSKYTTSNLSSLAYSSGNGSSEDERIVTYLIHGDWAHIADTSGSDTSLNLNKLLKEYNIRSNGLNGDASIEELVKASILPMQSDTSAGKLGNVQVGSGISITTKPMIDAIIDYNNNKGNPSAPTTSTHIYKGNQASNTGDMPLLGLIIARTYDITDVFNSGVTITKAEAGESSGVGSNAAGKITGKIDGGSETEFFVPDREVTEDDGDKNAFFHTKDAESTKLTDLEPVKLSGDGTDYWYLSPTLYQLSYYVCKASNEVGTVTVTYDGNADNVSGVPARDTVPFGDPYTVSDSTPTRDGYTFQNWNTSKNCDGTIIEPSSKINSVTNNMTLYACWGATGAGNNGPTGIITYAGLFTGIIALSGGVYYLVKKKNLFKKL